MTDLATLIAQVEADIADDFGGATTLSDYINNQADPLVNLVTTNLAGLIKTREHYQAFIAKLNPYDAEGQLLDTVAQLMGTTRQIDLQSKVAVIFSGKNGKVIPAGTTLSDKRGNVWTTTESAVINGYGWANACSPVGAFDLKNGELRLNPAIDGVTGTNAYLPDLGGEYETDEQLRRRLLNIRPLSRVAGTEDHLITQINSLNGVLLARAISKLPDCVTTDCGQYMISVLGGTDAEIAQAIFDDGRFSLDRLIGDTSVAINCSDVRFQRMCPTIVKVRYWLNCNCLTDTYTNIEQDILAALNSRYHVTDINAREICHVHPDVIKLEFKPIPLTIQPAGCCDEIYTNPVTGGQLEYCTDDPTTLCYKGVDCSEYDDCLQLNGWNYPVFLPEFLERGEGCPCPTVDGCGCR